MMKVLLKEVLDAKEPLKKLFGKELPVKTSYRTMRLLKKVESELKMFEQKQGELYKKHGTDVMKYVSACCRREVEVEEGVIPVCPKCNKECQIEEIKTGQVQIPTEKYEEFVKEINELVQTEVELEGVEPIKLDTLGDIQLSTADMSLLEKFITE